MLNAYATPQIFIQGRILNANGFNSDELYIKYKIVISSNFSLVDGKLKGETFQCLSSGQENVNVVHFDQPLFLNLSCKSITGWPKISVEVWSNEMDSRNCLLGYGCVFLVGDLVKMLILLLEKYSWEIMLNLLIKVQFILLMKNLVLILFLLDKLI